MCSGNKERGKKFSLEASGTPRRGSCGKVARANLWGLFPALKPFEASHLQFLSALPSIHSSGFYCPLENAK